MVQYSIETVSKIYTTANTPRFGLRIQQLVLIVLADVDTRFLPPTSYRLIVTTYHPSRSSWLLGATLSTYAADPRERGYTAQLTSVCIHTQSERIDLPAAGLPSHTWLRRQHSAATIPIIGAFYS